MRFYPYIGGCHADSLSALLPIRSIISTYLVSKPLVEFIELYKVLLDRIRTYMDEPTNDVMVKTLQGDPYARVQGVVLRRRSKCDQVIRLFGFPNLTV